MNIRHNLTMRDWKLVAAGYRLNIPAEDMERIEPVLDALEDAFRPLVQAIPPEIESAVTFSCEAEPSQ